MAPAAHSPRSRSRLRVLLFAALVTALGVPGALAAELVVSAASSLAPAFSELGRRFEREAGARVILNTAASDVLLRQLSEGAPVDVLATADEQTMNQAQVEGLVDASTRRLFARNRLVVITTPGQHTIGALSDLQRAPFRRIAIGNPATVPAGRYARAALDVANLHEVLADRLVPAQNVRAVLDYVTRGEVDAGFVYATDARSRADKVRLALEVPTPTPILYPIAVTRRTEESSLAVRFVAFVAGGEGQRVLARLGFEQP